MIIDPNQIWMEPMLIVMDPINNNDYNLKLISKQSSQLKEETNDN